MCGVCSSLKSLRWAPCRAGQDQPRGTSWAVCSSQTSGGLLFFAHAKRDPHGPEDDLVLISLFPKSRASGLGRTKELLVLMSHTTCHKGAQLGTLPQPVYLPMHLQHTHIPHHPPNTHTHGRGQEGRGMVLSSHDSESDFQLSCGPPLLGVRVPRPTTLGRDTCRSGPHSPPSM